MDAVFALSYNLRDPREPGLSGATSLQGTSWIESSNLDRKDDSLEKGLVFFIERTVNENIRGIVISSHRAPMVAAEDGACMIVAGAGRRRQLMAKSKSRDESTPIGKKLWEAVEGDSNRSGTGGGTSKAGKVGKGQKNKGATQIPRKGGRRGA